MKLVTWNVNSINARADFVALFLDAVAPDVLCVQELKTEAEHVPVGLFRDRGYEVAIHAQPRWNGVLVASKHPLTTTCAGLEGVDGGEARLIAVQTGGLEIVNLYCPQGQSADSDKFPFKLRFFEGLRAFLDARYKPGDPLVVTGDLNVAPEPGDVFSVEAFRDVPTFHPEEHVRWRELVAFGLHDAVKPRLKPKTFSFWDYRGGAFRFNQGVRIDHFLVTASVLARVQGAGVLRDWRKKQGDLTPSDHAPVELILQDA